MKTEIEREWVYEPPVLEVVGTVHELTLIQDKTFGPTDGFSFNGTPIMNRVVSASA